MRSQRFPLILAAVAVLATAQSAAAGMPSVHFNDAATLRLQTISFFLLGFLLSSLVILAVWNSLAKDFPRLPRLTFFKACGVVLLWGLLFVIVLTMISGARELMTPGAWQKNGATYKLRNNDTTAVQRANEEHQMLVTRSERLTRLGQSLRQYAREHDGKFPATRDESGIAKEEWLLPDASGLLYAYIPGRDIGQSSTVLAYEPLFFDGELVLLTSGEVRSVSHQQLRGMLEEAQQ